MDRRDFVNVSAAGFAAVGRPPMAAAEQGIFSRGPAGAAQGRRLPALRITDVQTILTQPAGIKLIVVKVTTSEPGLYGLGCATFTQRARVVETAIDRYLKPFLIGKDPLQIEDIFQAGFVSSYWRNGPVLGNALSGVDMALWDIVGKRAGMPVYQLFGGKCRQAVDTYRHTNGRTFQEVEKAVQQAKEKGWRYIRAQIAVPGLATYGVGGLPLDPKVAANAQPRVWEPGPYVRMLPRLFEHLRKTVGDEVELLHDV